MIVMKIPLKRSQYYEQIKSVLSILLTINDPNNQYNPADREKLQKVNWKSARLLAHYLGYNKILKKHESSEDN